MSRKFSIFFVALTTVVLLGACGCEGTQNGTIEPEPVKKDTTVVEPEDMIWYSQPWINVPVENKDSVPAKFAIKARITSDMYTSANSKLVAEVVDTVEVAGRTKKNIAITTPEKLKPGFYRAMCFVNGKTARNVAFGVNPFDIVSEPDKQPDYDEFWQTAKDQLAAINMDAKLTEIKEKSSASRKVYLVEFYSIPDGLTGDPVKIRGYYCEPQDGQKHPVIFHFYGYDTAGSKAKCECPAGGSSDYAEFYVSHRGQYLNNRPASTQNPGVTEDCINIYNSDWFAFNFGDKNSYYYRGAFMDCVQAVRFMATRETSDMTKLFAEGSSQGGALTYACAALSDYPFTAIACNVAFLGDYADAMEIGGLAAEISKRCQKEKNMSDEDMLAFLSYFDTKNLATRISCGVMASSGLKDDVCPARTNVVPFNNLKTPAENKMYIFGPEMGHDYPKGWSPATFFKKFM